MSGEAARKVRVCLLWVSMLLMVGAGACTTASPTRNGQVESHPPIKSESPEVQAEFETALQLLREKQWSEAVDALRLLQSRHSGDPTADLAELLIARALLGDLDQKFEGIQERQEVIVEAEVFSLLAALSQDGRVDERVRFAAQVYLAMAHALEGDLELGLRALENYPGASLSPVILQEDRVWSWPLVAESLSEKGRKADSLLAWGRAYQLHQERGEAEEPGATLDETDAMGTLIRARAFELSEDFSPSEVQRFLADESPLVRAVGAWTYIRSEVRRSSLDEASLEALQLVFNEIAPDFLAIDGVDRASELSVALASVAGPERLVIGALLPLSGPNRAVGNRALAGMLVALQSFHAAGEPSVTLVIEDSETDVVAAYHRLVAEGAMAVVGPMQTAVARELVPAAREQGVPVIAMSADRILAEGEEASDAPVFRNFISAQSEARAAARLSFQSLGDRRAAVVYPDMGYGRTMAAVFAEEFRRLGGEIVAEVAYDRQSSDYVATARAVARRNPDAIFLPDTGSKVAEITAFLAQENIWGLLPDRRPSPRAERIFVHYLGTSLWQDNTVLHQAASYVNGALVPAWYSPVFETREGRQFTAAFEAIYGRRAEHFEAFAYDSVQRLRALLLEGTLSDPAMLVELLQDRDPVEGATGTFAFGADGEALRTLRFLMVQNGEWKVYHESVETPLRDEVAYEEGQGTLEGM